jgi:formylglycine-generating enzyme required for sulfatase activity
MGDEINNLQAVTGKSSKQYNAENQLNNKVVTKGGLSFVFQFFRGHGHEPVDAKEGDKPNLANPYQAKLTVNVTIKVAAVIFAIAALAQVFRINRQELPKEVVEPSTNEPLFPKPRTPSKTNSSRVGNSYQGLNSDFSPLAEACQERPFVNSLGMRLVPFELVKSGTRPVVLFAEYETTVGQFTKFAEATGFPEVLTSSTEMDGQRVGGSWKNPGFQDDFKQTPGHPVVWVNKEDARKFCHWLTEREHAAGKIPSSWSYDLPMVEQWKKAFALIHGSASNLKRNMEGNWADLRYAEAASNRTHFLWKLDSCPALDDYTDGEIFISCVGAAQKSKHLDRLLWDMPGNVWEMTLAPGRLDSGEESYMALGGAWDYGKGGLDPSNDEAQFTRWFESGWRRKAASRYADVGFRCVLAPTSDQAPQ